MGFQIEKILIALVVFSVVMTGGGLVIADTFSNYDVDSNVSDHFVPAYDTIEANYNLSQNMKEKTLGGDIESGSTSWESMAVGSYSAIRLVTSSFTMFGDIINALAEDFGIPSFFIGAAVTVFALLMIFAIVYLIFRYQSG